MHIVEYFPKWVTRKIKKQVISKITTIDQSTADSDPETTLWFQLPCGDKSFQLANSSIRKIKHYCRKYIIAKFQLLYDSTKIDVFCNKKDKTPFLNYYFVVFQFDCPRCWAIDARKT